MKRRRPAGRRRRSFYSLRNPSLPLSFLGVMALLALWSELLDGPSILDSFASSEWAPAHPVYPLLLAGRANTSQEEPQGLWDPPGGDRWQPCVEPSAAYEAGGATREVRGYLQVFLEGGLNQQRIGICNAVAIARLLNASLALPEFDTNAVWQDPRQALPLHSHQAPHLCLHGGAPPTGGRADCDRGTVGGGFADVFDADHFIASLAPDVAVVRVLPARLSWSTRAHYSSGVRANRVKSAPVRAPGQWYLDNVLPLLQLHEVVAIAPFAHRLAFDGLPPDIQRLRCRVNFEALRFVPSIRSLGALLVSRLQKKIRLGETVGLEGGTNGTGGADRRMKQALAEEHAQPYLALHLRFDKDMVAHSACEYGGGWLEGRHMAHYRRDTWRRQVANSRRSSLELRRAGKCPLTPEEMGLLMAALGYSPGTRLYIAAHKLFPLLEDKTTLALPHELKPFEGRASMLAALDYYAGERAYRGRGMKRTVKPDAALLATLFGNRSITWDDFQHRVEEGHSHRMGQIRPRKPEQSLYTNPAPDCMCTTGR
eukprot:jgi/Mesen1/10561/ME000843S10066